MLNSEHMKSQFLTVRLDLCAAQQDCINIDFLALISYCLRKNARLKSSDKT